MLKQIKTYDTTGKELDKYALIKTQNGDMLFELFFEDAPQNVVNFTTLAKEKFYDGLNFHRVIDGFVAQGGCPNGNGMGGPGYSIKCEVKNNPNKHKRGSLSMAHAGRDTGGSQFFICFEDLPHLDGEHTVFGAIKDEDSMKVLQKIKQGDKIISIEILQNL